MQDDPIEPLFEKYGDRLVSLVNMSIVWNLRKLGTGIEYEAKSIPGPDLWEETDPSEYETIMFIISDLIEAKLIPFVAVGRTSANNMLYRRNY